MKRTAAALTAAATCGLTAALATPASGDLITLQFDLTEAPLGIFGAQFTADYITPVEEIAGGQIVSTRFHLEYDSTVAPNPLADAGTLAIDFQPPAGDLPIFTLTGADLGWSGTGQFTGDFETDALNLPILDFPPDAEFALWFVRIFNADDASPLLGGQLTNSYIQVDVEVIPAPATLALLMLTPMIGAQRRRRGSI